MAVPEQRDPDVADVLLRVGRRIAELRRTRGLTQEQMAAKLDLALKNYQRIERGRQNLTLKTMAKVAGALDVPLDSLTLVPKDAAAVVGRPRKDVAPPNALLFPLTIAAEPGRGRVPLLSLEAAAGAAGRPTDSQTAGWIELRRKRIGRGMFVARVVGESMQPLIPNGAYCLFEAPADASGEGEVLLVEHGDLHDPDTGASYTVKRVLLGERRVGSRRQRYARLVSVNPWFQPIELELGGERRLRIIARFVEVVGR